MTDFDKDEYDRNHDADDIVEQNSHHCKINRYSLFTTFMQFLNFLTHGSANDPVFLQIVLFSLFIQKPAFSK